jgi:hypothetical protein
MKLNNAMLVQDEITVTFKNVVDHKRLEEFAQTYKIKIKDPIFWTNFTCCVFEVKKEDSGMDFMEFVDFFNNKEKNIIPNDVEFVELNKIQKCSPS